MPTLIKKKKILLVSLVICLILSAVFIFAAPAAKAGWLDIVTKPGEMVGQLLAWLTYSILWVLSRLIAIAAFLLEAVFRLEETTGFTFTKVTVVTQGWQITRGLCNMLFAVILLVMAFDTILQLDKFPVKRILPKLILVALLINFSLVFCGIFIDFSQILTRYFIDAAGGANHSIADQLANGLNIAKVFNTPTSGLESAEDLRAALGGGAASLLAIFGSLLFGIVIILVATFAIGAGAIFMLIRLVSLWLLLITAPLAWVSMLVPGAPGIGDIAGKWWGNFFKWTFFAPTYAFFIYLAVLVAGTPFFNLAQTASQKRLTGDIFINSFLSPDNGISLLLQYVVIIIILIAGLQSAQTAGVVGAGKVLAWGKKAGDKISGTAKGYAKRPGQYAYDQLASGTVNRAGNLVANLGLTKLGGRIKAKATQMETKPEEREQHKAYAALTRTMSDQDLQNEVNSARGIRSLLAARQAKERGLLEKDPTTKFEPGDLKEGTPEYAAAKAEHERKNEEKLAASKATILKARDTFNTYGLKDDRGKTKEGRDLEDVAFDVLPINEQAGVIRRAKENGNLDKVKSRVLRDPQAMESIVAELSPPELADIFKKWGKKTRDAAEETLLKSFADLAAVSKEKMDLEVKKRQSYASLTGRVGAAFQSNGVLDEKGRAELANYVSTLTAAKVADIRHEKREEDLKLVGQFAKPELVASFIREKSASAEQKVFFSKGLELNPDRETKKFLNNPAIAVTEKEYRSKGINEVKTRARDRRNPSA